MADEATRTPEPKTPEERLTQKLAKVNPIPQGPGIRLRIKRLLRKLRKSP
jgi:hypothetical protein